MTKIQRLFRQRCPGSQSDEKRHSGLDVLDPSAQPIRPAMRRRRNRHHVVVVIFIEPSLPRSMGVNATLSVFPLSESSCKFSSRNCLNCVHGKLPRAPNGGHTALGTMNTVNRERVLEGVFSWCEKTK